MTQFDAHQNSEFYQAGANLLPLSQMITQPRVAMATAKEGGFPWGKGVDGARAKEMGVSWGRVMSNSHGNGVAKRCAGDPRTLLAFSFRPSTGSNPVVRGIGGQG